ncbi:MAG: PstS family phosphate ABC transporter substrate-binding protein [Candidatus Competibacteraceae bacterium]|nr:PstS family phosphate ABC transporter substrate-binding protein [Candidatus Competibacteraceae bacterium]
MTKAQSAVLCVAVSAAVSGTALAQSRDYISIVGSSTVYPFATVVAEQFGRTSDYRTPKIESTGSGGGIKLFCAGVGVEHPDITNASRAIKDTEVEMCRENGVRDITEVKIGYDGIVLANDKSAQQMKLTLKEIYLALAKQVPNPDGEGLVDNPYERWSQIDPALPDAEIEVLGPPPTSGTRDAFVELAMEAGCEQFQVIEQLEGDAKKVACQTMREDGAFVEAGENDNLIVQKLQANPDALGIFGFSFLDQNTDVIQGAIINGIRPTFDNIASGDYSLSRPLYFYVKNAHIPVIPGMEAYLEEFVSDRAVGEDGYLAERGLVPLPDDELAALRDKIENIDKEMAAN